MTSEKNAGRNFIIRAAAAAAILGALFLYGTREGSQKRKRVRGWMLRMKGEVLEELEQLKELNEETYRAVVDDVAKRYVAARDVPTEELEKVKADLKAYWKHLRDKFKNSTPAKAVRAAKKEIDDAD